MMFANEANRTSRSRAHCTLLPSAQRRGAVAMSMIAWLDADSSFPPLDAALREPNGLLAAGADLSPDRLIDAYRRGIYPWYSEGQPILWWSPDPRMVLRVDEFTVSRSLAKRVRRRDFEIRCDTAFSAVIEACAMRRAKDSTERGSRAR